MPFPRLADKAAYWGMYWAAFWGFTLGWSFRAVGRRHLPRTGPVLLVANHQSAIDFLLVGSAATRPLTFLARSNLFRGPLAGFIRYGGGTPIDRGFGKEGIQTVIDKLAAGEAVLMFPEGERTHTGAMQPLKPGVSLLVRRADAPIVPVGIAGAFAAWSRHRKWPGFAPPILPTGGRAIAVVFGEPVPAGRYTGRDREFVLGELEAKIRDVQRQAEKLRRK